MRAPTIQRFGEALLDMAEHEAAFLPYFPEMLDFELPENAAAEDDEIGAYWEAFNE